MTNTTNATTQQKIRRLIAIAQSGRYYGHDAFDIERYEEMMAVATELLTADHKELYRRLEADEGYATPKIDVRAFIQNEAGEILLVQDKRTKEWSLPGGYAEVNVSPTENVIKEVNEETGLIATAAQLAGVFDTNKRSDIPQSFQYYKLIFRCEVADGEFQENLETSAMDYFALDALPTLSLVRTTTEQLQIVSQRQPDDVYVD
ncbi:MAG: NUDIX hydrolase N-terminal domain-containing protein [Aerococcus sp.]|nr:NUDIX hydrolase N-terminal domain-containing protein [Aerococcus sp.]